MDLQEILDTTKNALNRGVKLILEKAKDELGNKEYQMTQRLNEDIERIEDELFKIDNMGRQVFKTSYQPLLQELSDYFSDRYTFEEKQLNAFKEGLLLIKEDVSNQIKSMMESQISLDPLKENLRNRMKQISEKIINLPQTSSLEELANLENEYSQLSTTLKLIEDTQIESPTPLYEMLLQKISDYLVLQEENNYELIDFEETISLAKSEITNQIQSMMESKISLDPLKLELRDTLKQISEKINNMRQEDSHQEDFSPQELITLQNQYTQLSAALNS